MAILTISLNIVDDDSKRTGQKTPVYIKPVLNNTSVSIRSIIQRTVTK
jgi:hypothetical protein